MSVFSFKTIIQTLCVIIIGVGVTSCHTSHRVGSSPGKNDVEARTLANNTHTHKIIAEANTWLGTPYKYAGQEKGKGTDCSGFVMKVYESVTGEKLPRNSAKQAEYCLQLHPDEVKQGDLVFFATGKDPAKISHVGIIIDSDSFIHASSSKGVIISDLNSNYYKRTFMMFGRVPRRKELISENN